ncbi:MAG: hypothetical protein ABUS56_06850 [Acidobacteriota bacterium]
MTSSSPPRTGSAAWWALAVLAAVGAAAGGLVVALHYHRLGLTLSHYDARGHLVVARRIFDSITPGWQQIGAVWLPLPHLLNALPVQVDAWYRTGASGVAISVTAYAVAVGCITWMILELTSAPAAALAGAVVFAANPNVLYLQATPMTEPLLLALTLLAVALLLRWCDTTGAAATTSVGAAEHPSISRGPSSRIVGCAFALACLTRYEAWPVTAAALAAAAWVLWRQGAAPATALRHVAVVAVAPALAVVGFMVFSRVVVGEWFVSSGFFVPENKALGHPTLAAEEVWYGLHLLSGYLLVIAAAIGLAALVLGGMAGVRASRGLVVVALAATAAVPWWAFTKGHPFRIRYMVPLIAIEAVGAGVAAGLLPRAKVVAALLLLAVVGYELRPLDPSAPMVLEAQWDRPNAPMRATVTACLAARRPGETIMASMGSLGHYMQETSTAGFALRDFLHEGNGDIWLAAVDTGPRTYAEWVLMEEKAEGGDMLARRAREDAHFLDGYARVCEGAGLALYRRTSPAAGFGTIGRHGRPS